VRATTLMPMSVAQMTQAAQEIVRARCVANATHWDHGELWTFTAFDVQENWRGTATGQISVRLLGGRTAQITSTVSGVPHFQPGEDVVLFLEPTSLGGYSIVSWQQGTFRIRRDAATGEDRVTQDTARLETYDPAARRFITFGIRGLAIEELRNRVQAAIAVGEGKRQ
jgi:hypothetical protein